MSLARAEWLVAGGLACFAAARLTAADRLHCAEAQAVPLLAFTPHAAAAAWASALLLRGGGAAATAALSGAALTAVTAPRAIRRRQPPAAGQVLRMLTANLLVGRAAAGPVVELVRSTGADVLVLQELTAGALGRLDEAGLGRLLPYRVTEIGAEDARGSGICARYPLSQGLHAGLPSVAQVTARLTLPSTQSVHLVCVHCRPPKPPWSRQPAARWRRELALLPPPSWPPAWSADGPAGGPADAMAGGPADGLAGGSAGELPGGPPVILAGDFNGTADHAQFRRLLRRGYVDAAAQVGHGLMPTWGPASRGLPALLALDHILTDPRCAVRATSAHPLPGSDHRAVYAEIRLPADLGLPDPDDLIRPV